MRFHVDRQWSHPVFRPGANDWPNADPQRESPIFEPPQVQPGGKNVAFAFTWKPSVGALRRLIEDGQAEVTGLLYCPRTWYRARFGRNGESRFRAVALCPVDQIRGRVEIHPLIVARQGALEVPVDEAHSDYRDSRPRLERGAPLGAHYLWRTSHDPTAPPLESFVELRVDRELEQGKFRLGSALGDERLRICLSEQSYGDFNRIRTTNQAFASLYLSALTGACAKIQTASAVDDQMAQANPCWNGVIDRLLANPEPDSGYVAACIRRFESDPDLFADRGREDLEEIEPEEAAQRLLQFPLGELLGEATKLDTYMEDNYADDNGGVNE